MLMSAVVVASVGIIANCSSRTKSYEPKVLDKAVDKAFEKCIEIGYKTSNCFGMSFFKRLSCQKTVEVACGKSVEKGTDEAIKKVFGEENPEALKESEGSAKLNQVISAIEKLK